MPGKNLASREAINLDQTLAAANARTQARTENFDEDISEPGASEQDSRDNPLAGMSGTIGSMEGLDSEYQTLEKQLVKLTRQLGRAKKPEDRADIGRQISDINQEMNAVSQQRNELMAGQPQASGSTPYQPPQPGQTQRRKFDPQQDLEQTCQCCRWQ